MPRNKGTVNRSIYKSFFIGFGLSWAVILAITLISTAITTSLDDPTGNIGIFALGSLLISAAISGFVCCRIKGDGGVAFSTLISLAVTLIMLLINVIACGGKVTLGAILNYICYIGVASLSALLGKKRSNHRKHRK